jgi:transposase
MPWKETRTVDQRLQFLSSYQREEMSVTDLCHEYGISRPTAYKWIKRYDEVGPEGLLDLTRTPHSSPHATSAEIGNEVLALRKRFPSWGARKLKARLERMNPNVSWPAASTVGQILGRAGLTNPKRGLKRSLRRRVIRERRVAPRTGAWIRKIHRPFGRSSVRDKNGEHGLLSRLGRGGKEGMSGKVQ